MLALVTLMIVFYSLVYVTEISSVLISLMEYKLLMFYLLFEFAMLKAITDKLRLTVYTKHG